MQNLRNALSVTQPPETVAAGTEFRDGKETPGMSETLQGVGFNWTAYQTQYAGLATNSSIADAFGALKAAKASDAPDAPTLEDLWNDLAQIFQTIEIYAEQMGQNLGQVFSPSTTSTSAYELISQTLINAAIDTTQSVLDTLIDALGLVVSQLQSLGNKPIQLPIFTALWDKISHGRPLTVFNAFSLILAIPATVLYKAARNSAPPSLRGMNKNIWAAYVNGTLLPSAEEA